MDKIYKTSDIYLSACLVVAGEKLIDIKLEESITGPVAVFEFEYNITLNLYLQAFKEDLLGTTEIPLRVRSVLKQVKLLKHKMYDLFKKI